MVPSPTRSVEALARPCRLLEASDRVGKAVEALRQAGLPALPVVAGGRVLGIVSEGDLLRLLTQEAARGNLEELRNLPVSRAMTSPIVVLHADQSIADARDLFASSDLKVLPVVDAQGGLRGVVTRGDLMSAFLGVTTPPHVGGLATPLGVFLTTGSVRGGAGDLGLFFTGAAMVALFALASLITSLIAHGVETWRGIPLLSLALHPDVAVSRMYAAGGVAAYAQAILVVLQLAIFLLLLRAAPLTGTHAAEHMVVHTLEEGDELTVEQVARRPRVHPRCGTNLMALAVIFVGGAWVVMSLGPLLGNLGTTAGIGLLVIVVYLFWRGVGAGLQRFFTTRRPSRRQIENAIAAARQLLARYQDNPAYRATGLARLWNIGLIQVGSGFVAAWFAAEHLSRWLNLGLLPFGP